MSVTRIQCHGCGFPLCFCRCKNELISEYEFINPPRKVLVWDSHDPTRRQEAFLLMVNVASEYPYIVYDGNQGYYPAFQNMTEV